MIFAVISPSDATASRGFLSFLYLVLVVLCTWLVRPIELKLIGLGLLTAVLAAWCAQLPGGTGASVQFGQGPAGAVGQIAAGGDASGILGRIAVLLILAGLVVIILSRCCYPAPTVQREEASRANPV